MYIPFTLFLKKMFDDKFKLHLTTSLVALSTTIIFIIQLYDSQLLGQGCLIPSHVFPELYRLITHEFIHLSILHLVMNLCAIIPFLCKWEKRLGSFYLVYWILVFSVCCGIVQSGLQYVTSVFLVIKLNIKTYTFFCSDHQLTYQPVRQDYQVWYLSC